MKFSCHQLVELVSSILLGQDSPYIVHSHDPKDNVLLTQKLIHSWSQVMGEPYMHVHNIVFLSQTGHLISSPRKNFK